MKRLLLITIVLLTNIVSGFSLDKTKLEQPIVVQQQNPTVSIKLPANPTTGFQWIVDSHYPKHLISSIRESYSKPDRKLVGAPGTSDFTITLAPSAFAVPQTIKLIFYYVQPWEMKHSNSFTLTLVTG